MLYIDCSVECVVDYSVSECVVDNSSHSSTATDQIKHINFDLLVHMLVEVYPKVHACPTNQVYHW